MAVSQVSNHPPAYLAQAAKPVPAARKAAPPPQHQAADKVQLSAAAKAHIVVHDTGGK